MQQGNDKNSNKRRIPESLGYKTRDGSYIFWPEPEDLDQSDSSYKREYYKGTRGRESKVFRPAKPRWKK